MNTILVLLALFGIKHCICDYIFQTSDMVAEKGIYGAEGGIHHAIITGFGTFFALFIASVYWINITLSDICWFGVIDAILHYHIDWVKQQLSRGLSITDHKFWVWFGVDQTLHYLTYLMIIAMVVN